MVGCWGKCHILRSLYRPHTFIFVRSHYNYFVCLFFFSTFVIYSCISLTIICFFIFVPTLLLLCMCVYTFVGNVCTVKIIIIHLKMLICTFQYMKLMHVLFNLFGQVMIFVLKYALINTKKIVTFIHNIIITYVHSFFPFLILINKCNQSHFSLFVSQSHVCISLVRSDFFSFVDVIPDLIIFLMCFLLTTKDLIILLRNRTCFLFLSSC